jgi:hypothetical protein
VSEFCVFKGQLPKGLESLSAARTCPPLVLIKPSRSRGQWPTWYVQGAAGPLSRPPPTGLLRRGLGMPPQGPKKKGAVRLQTWSVPVRARLEKPLPNTVSLPPTSEIYIYIYVWLLPFLVFLASARASKKTKSGNVVKNRSTRQQT